MPCNSVGDIENVGVSSSSKVEVELMKSHNKHIRPPAHKLKPFVSDLIQAVNGAGHLTKEKINKLCDKYKNVYRIAPSKYDIRSTVEAEFPDVVLLQVFRNWMIKCAVRLNSGVLVITITLAPGKFSCKYDCSYCPTETDLNGKQTQPRSYISTEPAMLRGLAAGFDIKGQFKNRVESYIYNGSIKSGDMGIYKMEVRLVGGTWESYPIEYREQVINEVYWAANTIGCPDREIKCLGDEILENETAKYRVIGLTIETRPDNITEGSIRDYCRWGITRVELGVQHFDDRVLKKNNRKCYLVDTIRAIKMLKQCAFKVHVHLMPDMPGSDPELDKWMFTQALTRPELQFDDVKIYPCAVIKSASDDLIVRSKIADWYADGSYKPYSETDLDLLIDVYAHYKRAVPPWVRITRGVRDIPTKSIGAGYKKVSNLRQVIHNKIGPVCKCLFCKEIADEDTSDLDPILVVRSYKASDGVEYFISVESHKLDYWGKIMYYADIMGSYVRWLFTGSFGYWNGGDNSSYHKIFGFLRLRLDSSAGGDIVPEINGCALIREVHVYGQALGVGDSSVGSQHRGFGQLLVKTAESIAGENGYKKAAVIAGVGTREYYKNKCGFTKGETYMLKAISPFNSNTVFRLSVISLVSAIGLGLLKLFFTNTK